MQILHVPFFPDKVCEEHGIWDVLPCPWLDDERRELLEDYRFYQREKRHRRPAVWKALTDRDE